MAVPFVLGVAADMFGCGYHRIQNPATWIATSGAGLANVTLGYPPVDKLVEMKPTAVVCQRPRDESELKVLVRLREDLGKDTKIIFEIDDLLPEVPEQNVHEAFQPPPDEVNANITKALGYCDWAVVPTQPLKDWLQSLVPGYEVKVIPNYLAELDGDLPKITAKPEDAKPRIGWGGSISHDGDLDLIIKAVENIEDDLVQWVFLGHRPRVDTQDRYIESHPGVPPHEYLPLLMRQDLELVLAPLEDNSFNKAKSNLRLIQAGAIGAAVIASPIGPYTRDNPPVFAYATTPEEFEAKIREWIALPEKKKIWHRARMRNWAKKSYGVKNNITDIVNAWGIANGRIGTTIKPKKTNGGLVINGTKHTIKVTQNVDSTIFSTEKIIYETDIEKATVLAVKNNAPLLVAQPGSVIPENSLLKLLNVLKDNQDIASVCGTNNDSAVGFSFLSPPNQPNFAPLDSEANEICEKICQESELEPRHVAFPLGLAILSPRVLALLPKPSKLTWDWGFLAAVSGFKNFYVPQAWSCAPQPLELPAKAWVDARGIQIQAVQSALTVEERVKLECAFIRESNSFMVGGSPGDAATWTELFVPEDENLEPKSVKVIKFGHDYNLDEINETWIRFEDKDLEIRKGADFYLEATGDIHGNLADVVYPDALGPNNSHFFKPHRFDREWFLAVDYVSSCALLRTSTLREMKPPVINSRLQLFGLLLEMIKASKGFVHCARPLYWEKETLSDEARAGMIKHTFPEYSVKTFVPGALQPIRSCLGREGALGRLPSVSVIILTTGKTWTLRQSLATLLKRTEYQGDWEVIICRTGTIKGDPSKLNEISNPRVKYFDLGPCEFNWSSSNNAMSKTSDKDILVFLNDDILVTEKNWLEQVVGQAERSDVGCVGIRLFFPQNGHLQHAGVYVGNGFAGHILKDSPGNWPGYWGYGRVTHEATAVTGACLAISNEKFKALGRFEETMAVNYSDVELCVKALEAGYKNICVNTTEMMHAESSSRPLALTDEWCEQISREGARLAELHPFFFDPYWNPNLKVPYTPNKWSLGGLNFDILDWSANWQGTALVLNDDNGELIIKTAWRGLKPIIAKVEKGRLVLTRPGLMNTPAIELIEKSLIREILKALGVKEILGAGTKTEEGKVLIECLSPPKPSKIFRDLAVSREGGRTWQPESNGTDG